MITVRQVPTWGHKNNLWDAAKAEAKSVLEKIAKAQQEPISYGELSRKVQSINFEPDGHDFHALLGQLSEESEAEGKGMISALVVRLEDARPGRGFFTLGRELGRNVSDPDTFWTDELKRVYRAFA